MSKEANAAVAHIDPICRRVLAEFDEMPGLRLTVAQASRLFGLEMERCRRVIATLVASAELRESRDGTVMRRERPNRGVHREVLIPHWRNAGRQGPAVRG